MNHLSINKGLLKVTMNFTSSFMCRLSCSDGPSSDLVWANSVEMTQL